MIVGYGLTEASPGVTGSDPEDPLEIRCGTVGRALPGLEVRVFDPETGEPRDAETEGELWVRGAGVMQGYFENPDATAEAITPEGWLRTGDLATLDDAGLVRIVGRLKDMIIRGGENVYPAEVEDALRGHESVLDANKLMAKKKIRHLAVKDNDKVVGLLSVRDLIHYFANPRMRTF